ncbi:MFS transporter [Sneathiella marina]|uniref:MFS transporter n=1 Tax=Sneathiella marina TaxID=2950108 RepID=A0ABY4VZW2_9PROT|nr:MFS transporter [Sneathiella marina]USG60471.1 MFS transporter [Sneathiella marina]
MTVASHNIEYVRRTAFSGSIGNVMEWYDFAVYAYLAPVLSNLFFPSDDAFISLMATFGTFAAGYISRPLGAIVFGHIGDKIGRKPVLILSVIVMGGATAGVGLLPTTEQIGASAAVMLVCLRIFQGLSVGGEYTGASAFIVEHSPPERRGFYASWIFSGSFFGFLLGSAVATLFTSFIDQATLTEGAWRLPFIGGGFIGIVAFYFRSRIDEPESVKDKTVVDGIPLVVALRDHWRDMLRIAGLTVTVNVGFYLMFVYAITFLTNKVHLSNVAAMTINTVCLIFVAVFLLGFAILSDKVGRKPVLYVGTFGILLFSWPLFWLMDHHNIVYVFFGQFGFAVLFAMVFSVNAAVMPEILPHKVRISALSVSYNLTLSIFGGTAPIVALYLVNRTDDDFSPVYYLMGLAILSLVAIFSISETAGKTLRD